MYAHHRPRLMGLTGAFAAAALGLTLTVSTPALAQDDAVVAIVNGTEITRAQVIDEIATLPAQLQQLPPDLLIPQLVDRLIDSQLMQEKALEAGLADDPEVTERMDSLRDRVIQQVFVGRLIDEAATDEAVLARYEATIGQQEPRQEVSARHILLETEEAARDAIAELDGGADFATLAQERSTGPSGPTGGDLGYFERERMVPEFADAAFAMDVGAYSADPVQTQFGWHVILVEDRRDITPPTLEQSEAEIRNSLVQEFMSQYINALRADADIEVLVENRAAQ